jgi:hypothetical protein
MGKLLLTLAFVLAAAPAGAQIKCWNDANGKRVCGDAPPAGAKVTTLQTPAGPAAPAARDGGAAAKKGGPLTPAEQEQASRKRQAEAEKTAAKADIERKDAQARRENCESAKEAIRSLETGRVSRTDARGERYYLDDAQVAQEMARARQAAQQWCN